MEFLSLDNILLLRRVIGTNELSEEHAKKLAYVMKFLNKYTNRISLKTLNKLVLFMFQKLMHVQSPVSRLDQLNLPPELKNAYSHSLLDFSKIRAIGPIKRDLDFLHNLQESTNDFFQSYVKNVPDGEKNYFDFIIDKTKQMKDLEAELFQPIRQTTYLTIDSRDRNHDNDDANQYRIFLKTPLKSVYAIQLVSAELQKSTYDVNEHNNVIHFQETNAQVASNEYYEATISVGNYTITELVPLIQAAMNAVGSSSYMVALVNDRVRITSDLTGGDNIFNLQFRSNDDNKRFMTDSLGRLLGFPPSYNTGSATYTAVSLYDLNYDHFALLDFTNVSLNGPFQKIPLTSDHVFFGHDTDYRFTHEFYPPIELDRLDVLWTDIDGNLMNFHGLPHSFTLKVDMFL